MNRKRHTYVHEWFAEVAAKHPERAAIDTGHGTISYRELHARARAIAAAINAAGATKNRPVVVFTDRRARMIAALIGALKAGAPFVPLTPDLPDARLAEMVAIADPACVLTDASLVARYETSIAPEAKTEATTEVTTEVTTGGAARVLTFESLPSDTEFVAPELDPEHFCYIYFSSGSTGEPKGIAGRLKAIDHFIRWELNTLGLEAGTRTSQLIAPTFDAFLRDVFVPLCSGGTICLPPPDAFLEGRALADWLDAQQINLIHCVPSLWRTIFPALNADRADRADRAERFEHLRHVLLSGEPVRPTDVHLWHANFGTRITLVNLYGPSETTMTKFAYVIQPGDAERRTIPIGKPMPGVVAYLADEAGNPTSPVGEICIRTPFRSAGYYRRPDLTAQAFVKNPFGTDEADMIYKTGDTGRILEDGNYEFLGRRDGQVKLRGIRIDLGEIENAIVATGLAREAVATVHEEDGGQTLCAYLILREGANARDLRERLRERLPAALVPGVLIQLERIPVLPNGKVDRRSLPNPKQYLAERAATHAEPLSPVEEIIAGVWCKLLRLPSVRREESFFELGGHSLLAAQATARVAGALDMDVPLRLILQAPRLGDFARAVQELMKDDADEGVGADAPELVCADRSKPLPLSFAQQRLWFIDQLEPGNAAYNVPFAVRLSGQLNVDALNGSLNEVVRRHETLRTTFPTIDGQPVQLIHEARPFTVPVADLAHLAADERERAARELAEEEAGRPFDLAADSLLRARLVRLSEAEHVLVVVMHHIISDGWSTGVLMREFSQLYEAYNEGRPSPLAELPIQYADYAVWQREWLQGEVLDSQLAYWREQLKDLTRLELPVDATQTVAAWERGGSVVRFELSAELTESLRELSRREGVTLFMVLMAAWQLLLSRY
ncbi:MAG TPA: amino acid adenylation domain-containing protein, partial [Pyrinomonadaceae bacterium]|nr:amino acid adenylation domain-containing protein [Pyrinomonadaceae bacterium]